MTAADALLAVGYLLAVPFTLFLPGFLRLWRRREPWVFATAQAGALLLVLGWALRGATASAAVNGVWLVGLTVAYLREGRSRSLRRGAPTTGAQG